jgi:hypothetical protein
MSHIERREQALKNDPDALVISVKDENNSIKKECKEYKNSPKYFGFLSEKNLNHIVLLINKEPNTFFINVAENQKQSIYNLMKQYAYEFCENIEVNPKSNDWTDVLNHMNQDFLKNKIMPVIPHDSNVFKDKMKNSEGVVVKLSEMNVEDIRQLDVWKPMTVSYDPSKFRERNKIPYRQTLGSKRNYERYQKPSTISEESDLDTGSLRHEREVQRVRGYDMSALTGKR